MSWRRTFIRPALAPDRRGLTAGFWPSYGRAGSQAVRRFQIALYIYREQIRRSSVESAWDPAHPADRLAWLRHWRRFRELTLVKATLAGHRSANFFQPTKPTWALYLWSPNARKSSPTCTWAANFCHPRGRFLLVAARCAMELHFVSGNDYGWSNSRLGPQAWLQFPHS
jgi:hypothetical protein